MPPEPPVTPLVESDDTSPAFIEPSEQAPSVDAPEACVVTFVGDVVRRLRASGRARLLTENAWEDGPHPRWKWSMTANGWH
jgi:uridine phosphorylase